jgi:lysophospholipase L1-like esterase
LADEGGLQKGDLLAICGDSITSQKGYSRFIEEYLLMCRPVDGVQAMQISWPGEAAYNFLLRQKNDCLVFNPTAATICFGMNDAGYAATTPDRLKGYRGCLTRVIENFKQAGVRFIIVGSPTVVDSDTFKKIDAAVYNKTLEDFTSAAKQVAEEQGVAFADIHNLMMDVMDRAKTKYGKGYSLTNGDEWGVHPSNNGHLAMAYAFLKAMGCSGDIGTITANLKGDSATATDGHKILSAAHGVIEVESTRYPFCFTGEPDKATTRSMVDFIPFNEDLNRFKLVVKNAPAPRLKVTWGNNSRVFPATELAKGINLAAEFLDNPFSEPFAKVDKVVLEQQIFESPASCELLHSLMKWRKFLPEQSDSYTKLEQAVIEKDRVLREKSQAAVVPVKHIITIEPAA